MPIVAYLANQFPSPVEAYVVDEIKELRRRGAEVISCSARRATNAGSQSLPSEDPENETLYLTPIRLGLFLHALWICIHRAGLLADLYHRILFQGGESISRRLRALSHTWLGAYYALLLKNRGVQHVHAHHGYFGSWIAMVAARFLDAGFSFTLHGSDLLLHPAWLDVKLRHSDFCVTISEFNRQHILKAHPQINPEKIWVQRMGADIPSPVPATQTTHRRFTLLAVGRLHPVKNHVFLLRACGELLARGVTVCCWIAGEGPEHRSLQQLVFDLHLSGYVHLLGHLSPAQLDVCYRSADLTVLTSHSEGIPITLMEAMARGTPVLAPAITGIPELVCNDTAGFLYQADNMHDFIRQVEHIRSGSVDLKTITESARRHVTEHFNREKNLRTFAEGFLHRINARHSTVKDEAASHAHTLLQQI
jgi:glycosyltransferase involved in cell wall biosynthesis